MSSDLSLPHVWVRKAHHPVLRFLAAFFAGVFSDLAAAVIFSPDYRLARSASIKLTTLLGAAFFAAAIGCPFCFLASNSANAAS